MWRNTVVWNSIDWLRRWNAQQNKEFTGFYGMDLYSMHTSIEAVLDYLEKAIPKRSARALSLRLASIISVKIHSATDCDGRRRGAM